MSKRREAVHVVPVFGEKGEITGYKGNLKIGDKVLILKHPALSILPVRGEIAAEDKWFYTSEIECPDGLRFRLSLNKQSLYAKDPRYISEVVYKITE